MFLNLKTVLGLIILDAIWGFIQTQCVLYGFESLVLRRNFGFHSDSDVLLQFYTKYDVLGEFILSGLPTPQTLF